MDEAARGHPAGLVETTLRPGRMSLFDRRPHALRSAAVGAATLFCLSWSSLAAGPAPAELPTRTDERLVPVFQADRVWNGVTTTREGRVFVCYPSADGTGVQAEEIWPDGGHRPYPDAAWNGWKPGQDFTRAFVCVTTPCASARTAGTSGQARRLLDGHPSTTARRPMYADGGVVQREKDGSERRSHADQLEVTPDGKYLYFMPCPGPMARIETRWRDDDALPPEEVARHVEANWWDAPTSGRHGDGRSGQPLRQRPQPAAHPEGHARAGGFHARRRPAPDLVGRQVD